MTRVAQDLRFAARTLYRTPGFTLAAVLVLALGIGATTAIFSLVNAVVLRPLPFVEPDRLVVLFEDVASVGGPARAEAAPASYVTWQERARSFDGMAVVVPGTYSLTGDGDPQRVEGARVTTNLFSLLGMRPILGRTFAAEDEGPEANPVIVISTAFWIGRFGGDPNILGRSVVLDGLGHTVIGVVPGDFRFPDGEVALWVPASFSPEALAETDSYYFNVVARLAPGTSLAEAEAEMATIARTVSSGQSGGPEVTLGVSIARLHDELARDARPLLVMLLAAVAVLLLVACANVASLLLARGAARGRELAMRKALGASNARLARQLLTESALLALMGVAVGMVLATLSFGYLATLVPAEYPDAAAPGLDWRVLAFAAGTALLTVLLFGAGPAFVQSRLELNAALKRGAMAAGTAHAGLLRNALMAGEIALTTALLAAAGLLLRSYFEVLAVEPGFRPENVLIAETALSPIPYESGAARSAFYARVLERVSGLPGVEDAGYVTVPPLAGEGYASLMFIESRPPPRAEEIVRHIVNDRVVTPGYLAMLGVPLIDGRYLDSRDAPGAAPAVVINEAMARAHWPDQNPIGSRLTRGIPRADTQWFTVVGVVGDTRESGLDAAAEPAMYFPEAQRRAEDDFAYAPRYLVVRTDGDPMALAAAVRNAVWEVNADQPVSSVRTMSDVLDAQLARRHAQLTLAAGFAAAALLLAAVGLYGVLSYAVAQRTSEIGVRIALGAGRRNVVRTVISSALSLSVAGIVLGVIAALASARLLRSFLYGVEPTDPGTLAAVAVLLLIVATLSSYVPARRAASVDPISALRAE